MAPKKSATASSPSVAKTSSSSTSTSALNTPIKSTIPSNPAANPSKPQHPPIRNAQDMSAIVNGLWENYLAHTPQRTKLLDVFLAFLVTVGVVQFVYCVIGGNYPFNAFLSGFAATVGQFVLTASLRLQTSEANEKEFRGISHERAFADYVFGSMILHFFCVNFIN